jgi:hypothetical protein
MKTQRKGSLDWRLKINRDKGCKMSQKLRLSYILDKNASNSLDGFHR